MRSRRLALFGLAAVAFAVLPACAEETATTTAADELRAERGFEFDCATPADRTLIDAESAKVLITEGHLRFVGDYGPNFGSRDKTYTAPKGTARVRYTGFETGEDCVMKVVADESVLNGENGQVRIQCAGDFFQQDILTCTNPKPSHYEAPPAPAPAAPQPSVPSADARQWECSPKAIDDELESLLDGKLTMQLDDASIRIVDEIDRGVTGARDLKYKPRSGNWMSYKGVTWGGDCAMSLVVDANALVASTTSTTLKVRCSGDSFQEDRYTCTPK
jgi:hypothetical protein